MTVRDLKIIKYFIVKLNKINDFINKWVIISLLLAVSTIWIPIYLYQKEQREIRANEIKFINQINIENLGHLKSRLNDLEREKYRKKIVDHASGKTFEMKEVQFWNNFWIDIYSDNFYIINKNYNYNPNMVKDYNHIVTNLEAINIINNYVNKLFSEMSINKEIDINNSVNIAILQEKEKEKSIEAIKTMIPVIINSYYQFHDILNDEGLKLIKSICAEDSVWTKEISDCKFNKIINN